MHALNSSANMPGPDFTACCADAGFRNSAFMGLWKPSVQSLAVATTPNNFLQKNMIRYQWRWKWPLGGPMTILQAPLRLLTEFCKILSSILLWNQFKVLTILLISIPPLVCIGANLIEFTLLRNMHVFGMDAFPPLVMDCVIQTVSPLMSLSYSFGLSTLLWPRFCRPKNNDQSNFQQVSISPWFTSALHSRTRTVSNDQLQISSFASFSTSLSLHHTSPQGFGKKFSRRGYGGWNTQYCLKVCAQILYTGSFFFTVAQPTVGVNDRGVMEEVPFIISCCQ